MPTTRLRLDPRSQAGPAGLPRVVRTAVIAAMVSVVAVVMPGAAVAAPPAPSLDTISYEVGVDPNGVAIGDLNGDGAPDLVSANAGANTVTVVSLDQNGDFLSTDSYPVGHSPRAVAIGDLNGDGLPDLAVANHGDPDPIFGHGSVSVLYGATRIDPNTGATVRTFDPAIDRPMGSHPSSIAIGDVNNDSHGDIAVGMDTPDGSEILSGPGFQTSSGTFAGRSVAIGDLDGDGTPDVASVDRNSGLVWVTTAVSGGVSFATQPGGGARSVAIGDLNGDGLADLVVANEFTNSVSVLFGTGNGAFAQHVDYPVGHAPWSVAIADLNLDGKPDIATANPGSADVTVLLNQGAGTFGQPPVSFHVGGSPAALAVGDLTGDGAPEIAVAEVISDQLVVLRSQPDTVLGSPVTVAPIDPRTGTSPVTITFDQVTRPGYTTVESSTTGPTPPAGFRVRGVYYELATTAQFTSAEVCFPRAAARRPRIAHFENGSWQLLAITRSTATEICTQVTSFSPFVVLDEDEPADTDAPVITCGAADGVWHGANVSIDCAASDQGSGLADPADAAFSLTTSVPAGVEDANASTGTRTVCDVAGNCATAGPVTGNKIDRKPPTLTLPSNQTVDATSPAGALVRFTATATDGADPSPGVSCSPQSGSTFPIGTSTVTCTATDHVANATGGSFTVTVRGAKEQLGRLIEKVVGASRLSPAAKAQLIAHLQALIARFDPTKAAQRHAVCTGLEVFTDAVSRLTGHRISSAQAAEWTADANRIRAVLGCAAMTHRARQTHLPAHHKHRRGARANYEIET